MTLSDAPVAASSASDTSAEWLWSTHYPALAGYCKALVGDTEMAHDLASEAFVRLISRLRHVHDPKVYLYVTATNLIRGHWRCTACDRELRLRLSDRSCPSAEAQDPWLQDLVERLPGRLRLPVLLFYFADLSVAQVASALHLPQGTIKRTLGEARAQLRPLLEPPPQVLA